MQYDKNKNSSLLSDTIPIKSLPDVTNVLCSLIYTIIKEGVCSDAWKFVARHCAKRSSQIQGIYFYQSYSLVSYADYFRINISITDMHRITSRILDFNNTPQNKNVTIHERVCASPPLYNLNWFEKYHHNVPLDQYKVTFYLQCMNGIQGTKLVKRKYNRLLDEMVTIIKYNKTTIDNDIYIKVFTDGTVPYLTGLY